MFSKVEPVEVGERAASFFGERYHCAEAVVAACFEALGEDSCEAVAHATAFGGGFGKSFAEVCGVLSGCMIVIGHLHGRRMPGENWDHPADLGAAVRKQFLDNQKTTNCGVLRDSFGDEQQMAECRKLVQETTVALIEIIRENSPRV
jgi:C_GCAxxG_C_C family probable redox protein